jgi:GNAT acetyltransferase-like protein
MLRDPGSQQWLVRAIVLPGARTRMIGHAGFHGPAGVNGTKKPGALEIGYTVFEPFRTQGYATEAVVALIEWARRSTAFVHSSPRSRRRTNPRSRSSRSSASCRRGDQWDEADGLQLVFELSMPAGAEH